MYARKADHCAEYRLSPILRRAHATPERMEKEKREDQRFVYSDSENYKQKDTAAVSLQFLFQNTHKGWVFNC